jgi:hypothetical protein
MVQASQGARTSMTRMALGTRACRCLVAAVATLGSLGAARADPPHRVQCPPEAPAEWGLPKPAPLEQVQVLSQPTSEPINETAPPSLMPDRGYARGNVWHNIWIMGDEPHWSHFIDCAYRGSDRVLRIKADGMRQCEQTAQPYSAGKGVADHAVQTLACD